MSTTEFITLTSPWINNKKRCEDLAMSIGGRIDEHYKDRLNSIDMNSLTCDIIAISKTSEDPNNITVFFCIKDYGSHWSDTKVIHVKPNVNFDKEYACDYKQFKFFIPVKSNNGWGLSWILVPYTEAKQIFHQIQQAELQRKQEESLQAF